MQEPISSYFGNCRLCQTLLSPIWESRTHYFHVLPFFTLLRPGPYIDKVHWLLLHMSRRNDPHLPFHAAQEEMLRPALRIQGASEDGGDLLLRANLTDDRRAIMATTPASSGPLTAGSHLLHVSLNGQFGGLNTSDMVCAGHPPSKSPCGFVAPTISQPGAILLC